MDFAALIAPLDIQEFETRYLYREPVVIRGNSNNDRAKLIDWKRLNTLLQLQPHWTSERVKLVLESRAIDPEFYMHDRGGRRVASPARIEAMMGVGATFVGDMVEDIDPGLAVLTAMLANRFAARTGANVYASFKHVQGFASHCDLHEVFAVQCEGAKRWRVYRNRADNPVEGLHGDDAQAMIDAAKGPVLLDVTLEVGDLIYIPRGYFHDALATDEASLHVTISVAPPSGLLLFNFLEDLARSDAEFRAYLPDMREGNGAVLQKALETLGVRLSNLANSPAMQERIGRWRRKYHQPVHHLALPDRPIPRRLTRTGVEAQVVERLQGSVLVTSSGDLFSPGLLSDVAAYVLGRPAVVHEEVSARFNHHPKSEIDALLNRMISDRLLTED